MERLSVCKCIFFVLRFESVNVSIFVWKTRNRWNKGSFCGKTKHFWTKKHLPVSHLLLSVAERKTSWTQSLSRGNSSRYVVGIARLLSPWTLYSLLVNFRVVDGNDGMRRRFLCRKTNECIALVLENADLLDCSKRLELFLQNFFGQLASQIAADAAAVGWKIKNLFDRSLIKCGVHSPINSAVGWAALVINLIKR